MYDTLLPLLRDRLGRVSVVVADIMSHAALDAAHTLRLPLILHNADALNVLSPDVLPADDTVPGLFEMISQRDLGLRGRMIYPVARLAARAVVPLKMDARLQPLRATRGLAPRPLLRWADGHLITHSLVSGLEHARALPPLIQMLGPCLPRHWPHLARADALPADLRAWLIAPSNAAAALASMGSSDSAPVAGLDAPVDVAGAGPTCLILVNMGTIARLNAAQTAAFYESLLELLPSATDTGSSAAGAACGSFKIIWKLRAEAQEEHLVRLLPRASDGADARNEANTNDAATTTARRVGGDWLIARGRVELRVSRWIPSQLALLQLPALRLFVSHCGINSAHEALFFGVPLLCIPLFAGMVSISLFITESHVRIK